MLLDSAIAPARWWHCACLNCVSGLRRLEISLKFLRCIHVFDLVLKYGSDIKEGNWLQFFFYFIVLMGIVTAVIGMIFFSAVFHVLDWSFLVLHFDGNVCNWIPKVVWPTLGYFWSFFGRLVPRFVDLMSAWTEIYKNCSIVVTFHVTIGMLKAKFIWEESPFKLKTLNLLISYSPFNHLITPHSVDELKTLELILKS